MYISSSSSVNLRSQSVKTNHFIYRLGELSTYPYGCCLAGLHTCTDWLKNKGPACTDLNNLGTIFLVKTIKEYMYINIMIRPRPWVT